MTIKVLLLNTACAKRLENQNVNVIQSTVKSTVKDLRSLHDFHAIVIDNEQVLKEPFWGLNTTTANSTYLDGTPLTNFIINNFGNKIKEQMSTGGITFIFTDERRSQKFLVSADELGFCHEKYLCNDFLIPTDLMRAVNEPGDTFTPQLEDAKYYSPLVNHFLPAEISWRCYFTKLPKNHRVIGVSRAGYVVFVEIPIGTGKLVLLPRFADMDAAIQILINSVIPQMFPNDELVLIPKWLQNYSSNYEQELKQKLGEIEKTKRLLFTKDKALKKAVAFSLGKLGFQVEEVPDGTNPDLIISSDEWRAICEVKGHQNRQTDRPDMLQLLGYSTENDAQKGIFITNHEFSKNPFERSKDAYTTGAITLGTNNDFCLLSTIDLYGLVILILNNKLSQQQICGVRKIIMNSKGLVNLSDSLRVCTGN